MFGLDDAEVLKRRKYVVYVWKTIEVRTLSSSFPLRSTSRTDESQLQVQDMRTELSSPPTPSIHRPPSASESSTLAYSASPYGEDDQAAWAREEQQMMMRQQDETMDSISGTLNILTQQASLMGQEIEEHNEYVPFIPIIPSPFLIRHLKKRKTDKNVIQTLGWFGPERGPCGP